MSLTHRRSIIAAATLTAFSACQTQTRPSPELPPDDYGSVRAAAEREVMRGESLRVEQLRFGALALGDDTLRLALVNESSTTRIVGVSIRTEPGLWVQGAWQRAFAIPLSANERRSIALPYRIRRLTPEGRLRLLVGTASGDSSRVRVEHPAIERSYTIGRSNPAALDPRRNFERLRTTHFDIYAYRGSPGARDIRRIADERERAVNLIGGILGVEFRDTVLMVLYPDSATKVDETGHVGMGWATNDMIVEIYNDWQRLDPFHELAHIIAGKVGNPPAMLDEGFATYVAELLGADALEHLGHAGRTVDQATCDLRRRGKRVRLDSLLRLSEFGSSEAPGDVMYPQGASAVKFLIEGFGVERFRAAFAASWRDASTAGATFARAFGVTPAAADSAWMSRVRCEAAPER